MIMQIQLSKAGTYTDVFDHEGFSEDTTNMALQPKASKYWHDQENEQNQIMDDLKFRG
jgi:hypothetical protein